MTKTASLLFVLLATGSVAAHHGVVNFDTTKPMTLRGTVAKIEWVNPHVVLTLDVRKDKGPVEQWLIALSPPSLMIRKGIARDAIKEGATMSVTGYAATTTMLVKFTATEFTLPDGRMFATGNANYHPIDPERLKGFRAQPR